MKLNFCDHCKKQVDSIKTVWFFGADVGDKKEVFMVESYRELCKDCMLSILVRTKLSDVSNSRDGIK